MDRLFSVLLLLYPQAHREEFAEEITAVFLQSAKDRRAQGWSSYLMFLSSEVLGLLRSATRLRISEVSYPARFPLGLLLAALALSAIVRISPRAYRLTRPLTSVNDDLLVLITLATFSVVFVAAAAVAFVVNLRILSSRKV